MKSHNLLEKNLVANGREYFIEFIKNLKKGWNVEINPVKKFSNRLFLIFAKMSDNISDK